MLPLYSTALCWAGRYQLAVERGHDAVRIAREAGDTDSTVFALQVLGLALAGGGAYDQATRVFDEFATSASRLREAHLEHAIPPKNERTVGHWFLYYWEHAARHLGMVEALRGVFGESGSARG